MNTSACMGLFEGGCHYLHYLHHSLTSGQTTGKENSTAHQQKIGLKICWAWPGPSEKDPVSTPHSQSLPSGSFHKPLFFFNINLFILIGGWLLYNIVLILLLSLSIRGQIEWKPQSLGIWSHHFMANRWGNNGNSDRLSFIELQNHCRWWLQPWN